MTSSGPGLTSPSGGWSWTSPWAPRTRSRVRFPTSLWLVIADHVTRTQASDWSDFSLYPHVSTDSCEWCIHHYYESWHLHPILNLVTNIEAAIRSLFTPTQNVPQSFFALPHSALSVSWGPADDKIEPEKKLNRNDWGKTSSTRRYRASFVLIRGLECQWRLSGWPKHWPLIGREGSRDPDWPLIGHPVDTPEVQHHDHVLVMECINSICVTRCSKSEDSRMENCCWRLIRIICGTDPTFHTWSNCVSVDTSLDGPATFYKLSHCIDSSLLKLADGLFLELFKMFWYLCLNPSITQAGLNSRGARCIGIVQRSIIIITPFIFSCRPCPIP